MKNLLKIVILTQLLGCLSPTKEELKLIDSLNSKFPNYSFAPFKGVEDVYLKLNLKSDEMDSSKLVKIYKETMSLNLDSIGNPRTNWLYLIVYDKKGEYLFTIREYGGEVKFFSDKIF